MKRLVFCFDGTWNRLDAKFPTNVVSTAQSVLPSAANGTLQSVFYDDGVGSNKKGRFAGALFGAGLVDNLAEAYRFLIFNHIPGDEIYAFGFSRGAFTARSFIGLINNSGILQRSRASHASEAVELYRMRQNTPAFAERMNVFRSQNAHDACMSEAENEWRCVNIPGYQSWQSPRPNLKFIGVWETVGALGIPRYIWNASNFNRQHQFHNTSLSPNVEHARHAVAIDERRVDFEPTLWDNLDDLNSMRGYSSGDEDAPYQQKWFPGVHGAVGGGGDRRGLSDLALGWVWEGARRAGLEFDTDLAVKSGHWAHYCAEFLNNRSRQSFFDIASGLMNRLPHGDRLPGPEALHEVSIVAQVRWHADSASIAEKQPYRPQTLARVAEALDRSSLNPDPDR